MTLPPMAQVDALAKPRRAGGNKSLLSLGWGSVGIDEGWDSRGC